MATVVMTPAPAAEAMSAAIAAHVEAMRVATEQPAEAVANVRAAEPETPQSVDVAIASASELAQEMAAFLTHARLSQYGAALDAQGWDDLVFLRSRAEEEMREVGESVGMKQGHLLRFLAALTGEWQPEKRVITV